MGGFRRRGDGFDVNLSSRERKSLRAWCAHVVERIGDPDEDFSGRLLPAAYPDDDLATAEFRRLAGPEIRAGKVAALETTAATAESRHIDGPTAEIWLRSLTDLRLAIGDQLDLPTDGKLRYRRLLRDGEYRTFLWLTTLQGALLDALTS